VNEKGARESIVRLLLFNDQIAVQEVFLSALFRPQAENHDASTTYSDELENAINSGHASKMKKMKKVD
jgi:hypothetical protein